MNLYQQKIDFAERFKRRLPLRLHMSIILTVTALSGLLTTRALLEAGVENIVLRYPLAVLFSYIIFVMLIKVWLKYSAVGKMRYVEKKSDRGTDPFRILDIPTGSGTSPGGPNVSYSGGGGNFSGAGASGSFDDDMGAIIFENTGNAMTGTGFGIDGNFLEGTGSIIGEQSGNAGGDAVGDAAGEAVAALGEEGGIAAIVVLAVIGTIAAVVIGAGVYVIYEAPFILSEAAFEVVLTASLVKSSRRINEPGWIGSVFRTTWIPFGISLLVAWIGAGVIHSYYPHVTKLSELVRHILQR